MAKKQTTKLTVETLKHDEATRKNIPTAEYQSVMAKDEQDWSDLVVHAPPLYIQEKVHPKVLIDDLLRRSSTPSPLAGEGRGEGEQISMFSDFNGYPKDVDKTEFYQHDGKWQNRMILGDSLQVNHLGDELMKVFRVG